MRKNIENENKGIPARAENRVDVTKLATVPREAPKREDVSPREDRRRYPLQQEVRGDVGRMLPDTTTRHPTNAHAHVHGHPGRRAATSSQPGGWRPYDEATNTAVQADHAAGPPSGAGCTTPRSPRHGQTPPNSRDVKEDSNQGSDRTTDTPLTPPGTGAKSTKDCRHTPTESYGKVDPGTPPEHPNRHPDKLPPGHNHSQPRPSTPSHGTPADEQPVHQPLTPRDNNNTEEASLWDGGHHLEE